MPHAQALPRERFSSITLGRSLADLEIKFQMSTGLFDQPEHLTGDQDLRVDNVLDDAPPRAFKLAVATVEPR